MSRLSRPEWWLPAKEFRHIKTWIDAVVLYCVTQEGGVGIYLDQLVGALSATIQLDGRPPGWESLGLTRRRKQIYGSIYRLCKAGQIERYYSPRDRTYQRVREVGVLDKILRALEESEQ